MPAGLCLDLCGWEVCQELPASTISNKHSPKHLWSFRINLVSTWWTFRIFRIKRFLLVSTVSTPSHYDAKPMQENVLGGLMSCADLNIQNIARMHVIVCVVYDHHHFHHLHDHHWFIIFSYIPFHNCPLSTITVAGINFLALLLGDVKEHNMCILCATSIHGQTLGDNGITLSWELAWRTSWHFHALNYQAWPTQAPRRKPQVRKSTRNQQDTVLYEVQSMNVPATPTQRYTTSQILMQLILRRLLWHELLA